MKALILLAGLVHLGLAAPASAGQETFLPLGEVVKKADVIWVFEIVETSEVMVPSDAGSALVQVSAARRLQSLKGDGGGDGGAQTFALLSSSLPTGSAVWRSLPKGRYLGFLNAEQAHYGFPYNTCLRRIGEDGKVEWLEQNAEGVFERTRIDLAEALKKVQAELSRKETSQATPPEIPQTLPHAVVPRQ